MKLSKILLIAICFTIIAKSTHNEINNKNSSNIDYRAIAFQQNELIIAYEEKVEELATVIAFTLPAYSSYYSDIDSLSDILDSLYIAKK